MQERYPRLEINLEHLKHNVIRIVERCGSRGIQVAGVIKGATGLVEVAKKFDEGGAAFLASSRLEQLEAQQLVENIRKGHLSAQQDMCAGQPVRDRAGTDHGQDGVSLRREGVSSAAQIEVVAADSLPFSRQQLDALDPDAAVLQLDLRMEIMHALQNQVHGDVHSFLTSPLLYHRTCFVENDKYCNVFPSSL